MSTTLDQLYILHVEGGSQVGPMTLAQVDSWMDSHPFERTVMTRAGAGSSIVWKIDGFEVA